MATRRGGSGTDQHARELAAEAVTRRFRRFSEGVHNAAGGANLHALRIAAKKLRYVCEFFAGFYPRKKVKRFLAALAALQDLLGAINDAVICRALVGTAAEGARPLDAHACGLALGWIAAGEAQASRRLEEAIKASIEAGVFWK